jgi:acyl-CoA thioester hydrolase
VKVTVPAGTRREDVLAEMKSSWCGLDAVTLKPARLARDMVRRFLPEVKTSVCRGRCS